MLPWDYQCPARCSARTLQAHSLTARLPGTGTPEATLAAMILSMFYRMDLAFAWPKCRYVERIIISRLDNVTQWSCEHCGHRTDLTEEPYAQQIIGLVIKAFAAHSWDWMPPIATSPSARAFHLDSVMKLRRPLGDPRPLISD
jgi:hypothetical protein